MLYAVNLAHISCLMYSGLYEWNKITAAGSATYVQNIAFDKNTGEIVEGKALSLNEEKIEDTFKIPKSEFDSRPVFVRTNDHIDAHFTTCFTSLVLIRPLQTKLDNNFSVGKIIHALKSYCCIPIDTNTYQFNYYDEILKNIGSFPP